MRLPLACLILGVSLNLASFVHAQDVNEALEKATKDAARIAAPSVVQIVTQGGADLVVATAKGPALRKALGPTTGVIVGEDGYIISSLFNFINNPTTILVALPGQPEPLVAKRVANDRSRMLTLLKIDAKGLKVPTAVAKKDITEGQFAIALGRTLETKKAMVPSISVGIISATGRIWGKALQTDAKISPVNYGGPIVDIQGRVQGILIPASPQGEDVAAGFEWYDSGIGFAIPFEDVLAVLPRLKEGKDLMKGSLGVSLKGGGVMGKGPDIYGTQPEIAKIAKDSAAEKAGLKPGDQIVEVEGHLIIRQAQLQHALGTKYEGDRIALKYKRDGKVIEVKDVVLIGSAGATANAFLGILPLRDDPRLGVGIRYVFAKSPAEKAGLLPGERITKFGVGKTMQPFSGAKSGRDQFFDFLNAAAPGAEIQLEIADKDAKTRTVPVTLDALPGSSPGVEWSPPAKIEGAASAGKANEPLETAKDVKPAKVDGEPRKIEKGLLLRNTGDGEHKYWVYVPQTYDGNTAHGILVWLHPPGRNKEADAEDVMADWKGFCAERHLILLIPKSENPEGWIASEADFVVGAANDVLKQFTIDRQRVISHGMGIGGQMALHLAMNHRDLFRGAATVGAVPSTTLKDNQPQQRSSYWLSGGELDPLIKSIRESRGKLAEKRYSAVFEEIPNRGREYLTDAALQSLARWLDVLDKQ